MMDLLLIVLVAGLVLVAAGLASAWAIFLGLCLLAVIGSILAFPFLSRRDPLKRGRALKREVLLGTIPRA